MTYCVAMNLFEGLVFVSDSRTNAGVDNISVFRKLHTFGVPGDRLIVLQTAGNLATSQSVLSLLRYRLNGKSEHLYNVPSMFTVARLVGETLKEVVQHDSPAGQAQELELGSSFLVGGQIGDEPPRLFNVYPQGNFIESTEDTPFFQVGESKYGKPIIDRALSFDTPLEQALRCALISFDSTIRSNLSVALPLDLLIYKNGSLAVPKGYRIDEGDPYFEHIRYTWSNGLRELLSDLPEPPSGYWS